MQSRQRNRKAPIDPAARCRMNGASDGTGQHVRSMDYSGGIVVFGFVIPLISVHMGLRTRGGAAGVGLQTTQAVMFMILTILIIDAMFPPLLLQ